MINSQLLLAVATGVSILLFLILFLRIQAFISLLIASITVGLVAGMSPEVILTTMQRGMGNTLGYVALVVGLGAMFGAILEQSGGTEALANYMLKKFGEKKASWALMITGFFIAIPVFFDVAFIILVPIIYSLQRKSKKSLLLYAIPLLAGLAITHAFIPPTPGPVAVAIELNADLGWVIIFGFIVGVPTAIVCGPVFGKYIAKKIHIEAPKIEVSKAASQPSSVGIILIIISIPILLIICNTVLNSTLANSLHLSIPIKKTFEFLGNPFIALIIANLIAWYVLGIRKGYKKEQLLKITTKSMATAGTIILLTGAGGVFKEMLINTGAGEMLANYFSDGRINLFFIAFITAAIVRILQGSATVAMITAASITAALIGSEVSETYKALLVIAIASGASILSHVNDSGFWLVSNYLGLTEKQTFRSWTVMTTILALTGFSTVLLITFFV